MWEVKGCSFSRHGTPTTGLLVSAGQKGWRVRNGQRNRRSERYGFLPSERELPRVATCSQSEITAGHRLAATRSDQDSGSGHTGYQQVRGGILGPPRLARLRGVAPFAVLPHCVMARLRCVAGVSTCWNLAPAGMAKKVKAQVRRGAQRGHSGLPHDSDMSDSPTTARSVPLPHNHICAGIGQRGTGMSRSTPGSRPALPPRTHRIRVWRGEERVRGRE